MRYREMRRRPRGWLKDRGVRVWAPLAGYAYVERSSPSTLSAHNTLVGTVNELTGVGAAMVAPSDGTRPTLNVSGGTAYMSVGSGQYMAASLGSTPSAGELQCCVKMDANNSGTSFFFCGGDTNSNHYPWSDNTIYDGFGLATRTSYTRTDDLTAVHVAGRTTTFGGSYTAYYNGSSRHTASGTAGFSSSLTTMAGNSNGSYAMQGRLYAAAIAAAPLSTADRETLQTWLGRLGGISV